MDLKKELCQVADVTRGRISRAQTFSDFLAYCALLSSSRTDPVHRKDRMEQLQKLKGSYHDAEWRAFHQTLCLLQPWSASMPLTPIPVHCW